MARACGLRSGARAAACRARDRDLGAPQGRGFQIPAQFAQPARLQSATLRRRQSEGAPKCVAEMAVAGEAQLQSQRAQIELRLRQTAQPFAQAQAVPVLMDAEPCFTPEQARQM